MFIHHIYVTLLFAAALSTAVRMETVGPVCIDEELVLACDQNQYVTAQILGGIHENSEENKSCNVQHEEDCLGTLVTLDISQCIWTKHHCAITFTKFTLVRNCSSFGEYVIAKDFKCVNKSSVFNASANSGINCLEGVVNVSSSNEVYIRTEEFPAIYPTAQCSHLVVAPDGYGLNVTSLHMDFPSKAEDQYVRIQRGQDTPVDFRGPSNFNVEIFSSRLTLSFKLNKSNHMKGFVIKIQTFPLPPTTTTTPTVSKTSSSDYTTPSSEAVSSSKQVSPGDAITTSAPSLGTTNLVLAVIAGVFFLVCCALAVKMWFVCRSSETYQGTAADDNNAPSNNI